MPTTSLQPAAEDARRIAAADDFHIAPLRADGATPGTPTWIWSVLVQEELYVRAYNGPASRWYQAVRQQQAGQIQALDQTWNVTFEPVEGTLNDQIDAAYRTKYASSPYLSAMLSARARAATVRVVLQEPQAA